MLLHRRNVLLSVSHWQAFFKNDLLFLTSNLLSGSVIHTLEPRNKLLSLNLHANVFLASKNYVYDIFVPYIITMCHTLYL